MLHHASSIALLSSQRDLKSLIRDYFGLPLRQALMPALLSKGLGQADLVLCLLRLRDMHAYLRERVERFIALLIGHPIVIGPGCLLRYRCNGTPAVTLDRSPRIVWVTAINPRQPNTDAYLRWPEYRVGRTTAQLKMRGVRPKDIRVARRNGWIRVEERA